MFGAKPGETLTDARVGQKPAADSSQPRAECSSSYSNGSEQLPVGDAERYSITEEHSRGGLGRVLCARDQSLGRTVALKELLTRTPAHEERFIREALITARLQHPSIVPVHEAGRWPSGDPYYVMKLIHGETLKQRIALASGWRERLALLPNAIAVADAVAFAHAQSIIHRDIKPSNVVVGEFGETVVVDWGLAVDLSAAEGQLDGEIVGTPAYMPPEQARGDSVDRRADVYALGALLYHMLTGRPPYTGDDSDDRLHAVLAGAPQSIRELEPHVPTDLVAIVEKAMARERRQRYASAADLAADLKRFQTGKVVTAQEYTTLALVRRWLERHRAAVAFTAATLTVFSVAGVLAVGRIVDERNTARDAHSGSERRRAELLYLQAESSILSDPTAAVAWLKEYPEDGPRADQITAIAQEARAQGVALDVFDIGEWVMNAKFVGSNFLVTADKGGSVRLWKVGSDKSRVIGIAAGPDPLLASATRGSVLAYGRRGGEIVVVDLESGVELVLEGHEGRLSLLRFSPDGSRLISTGDDKRVRIWDLASATQIRELVGVGQGERGNVSRDGTTIATIAGEFVRWREIGDEGWRERRVQAIDGIRNFVVAPKKKLVAVLSADGLVRVIDLESGKTRTIAVDREPSAPAMIAEQFEFSPSGRYLSATGSDRTIRVWDLEGGEHRVLRGHQDSIYMANFSADESLIVSAGDDGTARLWDLRTGAVAVLRGHQDDVIRAEFSADGKLVATASLDGTARIWPTRFDDSKMLIHEGFVAGVDFPRPGIVVSQSLDGRIRRWEASGSDSGHVGSAWPGKGYPDWRNKQLAHVSPTGRWAAGLRSDGRVDLWSVDEQRHRVLDVPSTVNSIIDLAFSPGEQLLAASDGMGHLVFWPTTGGEPEIIRGDPVSSLRYAPDGSLITLTQSELLIRSPSGDEVAHRLRGSRPTVSERNPFSISISPHGDRVAAYRPSGLITVCGRASGSCRDLSTGNEMILGLAFSQDASLLAAACVDRTVRLWDLAADGEMTVLAGHTDLVQDVAFAPGGDLLASSSYDKTVRLWNPRTKEVSVLRGHSESVEAVSFSPAGDELASASRDGTVRVWQLSKLLDPDHRRSEPASTLRALTSATISGERPVSVRVNANELSE